MGRNGLGRFVLSRNLQKVEAGRLNRERQTCRIWGCSSAGRAPALQAGGRQFESVHLHQGAGREVARPSSAGHGLIAQVVRAHA